MKAMFLMLLPLIFANVISAQLAITPGGQFSISGNMQISLQNTDLVNNGNFTSGNSVINFLGEISSTISGTQPVQFFELVVKKSNNTSVVLRRAIDVMHRILFSSGFLNLNGFNTDLGTTGFLDGEQETSRIIGLNGGQVLFSTILNAPIAADPGNLGAIISSNQNLGNVVIKRGHQEQAGAGLSNSILRYYDIVPATNTALNATLRFNYFDAELNGINENLLEFFKSEDVTNWSTQGFTSRNAAVNFVEKTGIGAFSRWTLSSDNSPLPLHFLLFNAKCEDTRMLITWKTTQEQNTSRFDIERSADAIHWNVIGNLPASGNASAERSYSFVDNNPVQNGYYRIAENDLDGNRHYTTILPSSCMTKDKFSLWPNPFGEMVFLNIVTNSESQAIIHVFDSKGALIKIQKETVLQGSNQLTVDLRSLAKGVYSLYINWNNEQTKKTIQIIKQ